MGASSKTGDTSTAAVQAHGVYESKRGIGLVGRTRGRLTSKETPVKKSVAWDWTAFPITARSNADKGLLTRR